MDFVFSTESFLDFVSESFLTSNKFKSESDELGGELFAVSGLDDVRAGRSLFFTDIPSLHSNIIWLVLIVLALSLNPIVWWHYYGVKSSNRPYVLAFVLMPRGGRGTSGRTPGR